MSAQAGLARIARGWAGAGNRHDAARAGRSVCAVMVPVVLAASGQLPLSLPLVALAANSIVLVDVRGAYTVRLALLVAMTALLASTAALGAALAPSVFAAAGGALLVAVLGGICRHFVPDYGGSLAISSTLLYLLAVSGGGGSIGHQALSTLVGGLWGVLLQVSNWPIRPQHPIRRAVSDSWVALADLLELLATRPAREWADRVHGLERALRSALDHGYAALDSGNRRRAAPLRAQLAAVHLAAARLATRVVALQAALEAAPADDANALARALQPALTSLMNAARSVAVGVVSRQPSHLAALEVRLERLDSLLHVVWATPALTAPSATALQLREILRQIEDQLPAIRDALQATLERGAERAAFSLELFDLHTWTLRPLASALHLHHRPEPALLRFTARLAVLVMAGVALFKTAGLPHGYWLPLTSVIVLQPDYGSTRRRAAERVLGTLSGSLAASALLWLSLPRPALLVITAASVFGFAFFLKRRYTTAVFFITLFVVLLTEAHVAVTWAFTAERFASTLGGGALALLAALLFWPTWERDRLRPILAASVHGNREFLRLIADRWATGGSYDAGVIAAKRRTETANQAVFASLERMLADPANRREGVELGAVLANGNRRITRALTVLALQLTPQPARRPEAGVVRFSQVADAAFADIHAAITAGVAAPALTVWPVALQHALAGPGPAGPANAAAAAGSLHLVATELGALAVVLARDQPATGDDATTAAGSPARAARA